MKNSVKKVPVILQMESVECGAASLAMILAYYKRYVPLEQLRWECGVSRDGSSAKYVLEAAKLHGLEAKAFRMSVEQIRARVDFPMIIHWNFNHFVVLCGFKGEKAVLNDPAEGRVVVTAEEFDHSFTGIAMAFHPTERFQPGGHPTSIRGYLGQVLRENRPVLVFTLTMGLILAVIGLTKPVFYKIFTDDVLIGGDSKKLSNLLLAMVLALVVSLLVECLQKYYLAKLQAKLSAEASSSFLWHVLRLPVSFFSQRYAGDIASRQQSNEGIAETICTRLMPVCLDLVMLLIYLAVLIYYNVPMALIGVAMAALEIAVMAWVTKQNGNAARSVQRDAGKLSGAMVASVSMIETIKASGAETGFFEKLAGYQAKYHNSTLALRRRNVFLSALPRLLSSLSASIVLMVGVYNIFSGDFTIGSLMAFQGFMSLFLDPVGSLVDSIQAMQELQGDIGRVEDVMRYPTDVASPDFPAEDRDYQKLSGRVELRNVSFGYNPLAPVLLEDFSLTMAPGSMTALAGGSGSGKSTLAKLLMGLYPPREGQILFDGKSRAEIDRYIMTGSVAMVDQSISLFSGTIRDNITMWDETIPQEDVIEACQDACIHDDVMALKDGYNARLTEGGKNLSGGQRQRLEIARAFVIHPSILILDEATSALDPLTEKKVMDAVKRRGMTCLVIAHRLSTIRDADTILVLDHGREVERGTHEELLRKDGKYAALVRSE